MVDKTLKNNLFRKYSTQTLLRDSSKEIQDKYNKSKVIQPSRHTYILPKNFDGRVVWKGLLTPVMNQGECGACWAVVSVNTLASKFNIQTNGKYNLELSPAKMIFCYFNQEDFDTIFNGDVEKTKKIDNMTTTENGCVGNTLLHAWEYLYVRGTVTTSCVPYSNKIKNYDLNDSNVTELEENISCTTITGIYGDNCVNGSPARFYRAEHIYYIAGTLEYGGTEENIRSKIYEWGPVSTAMYIYPDFYTFDAKNNIYKWNGIGEIISGHAIMLVGWGVENGIKYWIAQNSWGKEWGDKGYFKILRGANEAKIEENVISGSPDFTYNLDASLIPGYKFAQEELAFKNRIKINDIKTKLGQSPISGYSYRHINLKNVKDTRQFSKEIKNIDWKNFIAGKLNKKNYKYLYILFLIIFLILFLIIFLILFFICFYKNGN